MKIDCLRDIKYHISHKTRFIINNNENNVIEIIYVNTNDSVLTVCDLFGNLSNLYVLECVRSAVGFTIKCNSIYEDDCCIRYSMQRLELKMH